MSDWYYARGGERFGPVSRMKIEEMARQGELALTDLLWTESMTNWQAAGEVSGIFPVSQAAPVNPTPVPVVTSAPAAVSPQASASAAAPVNDRFLNPYATPQSERARVSAPAEVTVTGDEIAPGSEPIDIGQVVRRSWQLTFRHYGFIFLTGVVYMGIMIGISVALTVIETALGWAPPAPPESSDDVVSALNSGSGPLSSIGTNLISVWLSLGLTRIGLNLVSGAPVTLGQLFGEGGKLFKAIAGSILYGLMIVLGCILLIVPGIYLALRYGQFMNAIVDKDLGIFEAFSYSSALTTNNKWNLVAMGFVALLIVLGGFLALLVGAFIAYPMVWLMTVIAYRWMQFGHRAVADSSVA